MWYEILPSAGLVLAFLWAPSLVHRGMNYVFHNRKSYARFWEDNPMDYNAYRRDVRITGSEYVPRGLESIPDEKEK